MLNNENNFQSGDLVYTFDNQERILRIDSFLNDRKMITVNADPLDKEQVMLFTRRKGDDWLEIGKNNVTNRLRRVTTHQLQDTNTQNLNELI